MRPIRLTVVVVKMDVPQVLPGRGDHTIRIFPGDQQMTDVEEEVRVGMSDVPDKLQRACGRWQGSGWGKDRSPERSSARAVGSAA